MDDYFTEKIAGKLDATCDNCDAPNMIGDRLFIDPEGWQICLHCKEQWYTTDKGQDHTFDVLAKAGEEQDHLFDLRMSLEFIFKITYAHALREAYLPIKYLGERCKEEILEESLEIRIVYICETMGSFLKDKDELYHKMFQYIVMRYGRDPNLFSVFNMDERETKDPLRRMWEMAKCIRKKRMDFDELIGVLDIQSIQKGKGLCQN